VKQGSVATAAADVHLHGVGGEVEPFARQRVTVQQAIERFLVWFFT